MDADKKPEWSDPNEPDKFSSVIRKGQEQEAQATSIQKNIRFQKETLK